MHLKACWAKTARKPSTGCWPAPTSPREGLIATVVGIITLVFAAIGVVVQLKDAFNTVWELKDAFNTVWEVEEPKAAGI